MLKQVKQFFAFCEFYLNYFYTINIMETKVNIREVIKRLKALIKAKTDEDLANYLGISRVTISTWKARNSIDWQLIFEKFPSYDLNHIVYGISPVGNNIQYATSETLHCETSQIETELRFENTTLKAKLEQSKEFIDLLLNRETSSKEVNEVVATSVNY